MVPMLWNLLLFFLNVKFSWFNIVETIGLITGWFFRNAKLGAKSVWVYKYLRMMNLLVFSIKLTNIVPAIRGSCGCFLQISTSHSSWRDSYSAWASSDRWNSVRLTETVFTFPLSSIWYVVSPWMYNSDRISTKMRVFCCN